MVKRVLVTGGNSGIGFATARLLIAKGYHVTISGRDRGRVERAAQELNADCLVADMGRLGDIENLAQKFQGKDLDVLVNNAAVARFMPIELHRQSDYDEFFNVNIRGPLALIQGLLPSLEKSRGCIVNVSSAVTRNGLANASLYAATKGAMDAFTRSLAVEFAPRGIRVNAVTPGAINTPIINKLGLPEDQIEAIRKHQEALIPLGRFGEASEVAQVIAAQIESTYVSGSIWSVDGGVDAV